MSNGLRGALERTWSRLTRDPVEVWHHPDYRLPLPSLPGRYGLELRRADLALWTMQMLGITSEDSVHSPLRLPMSDLARVHDETWLDALTLGTALADTFGVEPGELPVDEVFASVRLACGGTLEAARAARERGSATLNLLGGFHHAAPGTGAGLCPVNDIAVAIAVLREEGLEGTVGVLDLDAHPPDGTAACLAGTDAWIGSISGSDWGPLVGVDETVLPGADDVAYLQALEALLARMPVLSFCFVIAGGDVLAGDRFGLLAMTGKGVRQRDRLVHEAIGETPSTWLPGGGYHNLAWRLLAGTALVLAGQPERVIDPRFEPLSYQMTARSRGLSVQRLKGERVRQGHWLDLSDMDLELDQDPLGRSGPPRLLDFYTAAGVEYALFRLGLLSQLQRLGYHGFQVQLSRSETGDRVWLSGWAEGVDHRLVEMEVNRTSLQGHRLLYVNWLTLRHPLGRFGDKRPQLPGQEVPGLGMADEAGLLLGLMAERLDLDGVAMRPAHFHVAYASRRRFRFFDAAVQGHFDALCRDLLGDHSLLEVTHAISEGRVRNHDEPWAWPPEPMIAWREGRAPVEATDVYDRARDACRFTIDGGKLT